MRTKVTEIVAPNGSKLTPAQARVIDYMERHGSISAKEAEDHLHNHRLASTIEVLRNKKGYEINTLRIDVVNVYGEPTWYGKYVFAQKVGRKK